jgi:formamidopyrimidine-DNA glycosylase
MPELPEVETVRRGLASLIIGRSIKTVEHDTPKSFPNATADVERFLIGATVTAVRRRAKVLMIDLSTDYTLVIHLKMTGQMVFVEQGTQRGAGSADDELRFGAGHPNESLVGHLPDRSTRVTFTFVDGSHLYFNDQRKFGWIRLLPTLEVPNIDFMKKVGPEPLDADFTAEQFAERFKRRARTSIKAALLDQTVIAGVGNIYADESLWGAKIHPKRLVGSITSDEFRQLYAELRSVMNTAIEKGGSTDKNYVNAEGKRGSYLTFARVFRREGKPCPRCGTTIIKFKAAGRGTHVCPHCQVE